MIKSVTYEKFEGVVHDSEILASLDFFFANDPNKWCLKEILRFHDGLELRFKNGQVKYLDIRDAATTRDLKHAYNEQLLKELETRLAHGK